MGNIQYHEVKVLVEGKEVEQEWLTITGVVADALTDGQEIIYTSYKGTDGSSKDAEILQVKKWNGETHLIYREPRMILEKFRGKEINLELRKKKGRTTKNPKKNAGAQSEAVTGLEPK